MAADQRKEFSKHFSAMLSEKLILFEKALESEARFSTGQVTGISSDVV